MHGNVEKTYKRVTQIQHILMRPDMYIGPIVETEEEMVVVEDEVFVTRSIKYIPGLYKIFDQILVNAADNYQRDRRMTKIEVTITAKELTVYNDGKGIPVQMHKGEKIYVPQMIFGHLLTSSNYEDDEKKVTGGRNGYGAKLANIFSTEFNIEIADSVNRKLLKITWENNMKTMREPIIEPYEGKDYTKIIFKPDLKRFNISKLSADMIGLMKRRVYDMAGILKVKVYLNGKFIQIANFKQYVRMHIGSDQINLAEMNNAKSRWQVYVCQSEGHFCQVSFVNGISTSKGGTHVNYLVDQIVQKMIAAISKKSVSVIKPFQVKAHLRLFVNCLIDNPCFDSQAKQTLTTNASQFGSVCEISNDFIKELLKMGIVDAVLNDLKTKEKNKIDRELKKVKRNRLIIPKLEDANEVGRSNRCCLILTEGDSAKALALCGMEEIGRDYYGVYPLKGKTVNVKELSPKLVMENVELSNLVKIIGLTFEKQYSNTDELRYSSVMIMADQDNDGSHIKGLVINFFETFWPSLCRIQGFLKQFITPIIKCRKGNNEVNFYSQVDYQRWKSDQPVGWTIKYYKGLGTSTSREAKQYFSDLDKHVLYFIYSDQQDQKAMQLGFLKKKADVRKQWLQNYDPNLCLDHNNKRIKVSDFINKELIHFSNSDNIRSIPSVMDGLKPSQRKILYACFKRNLTTEIKVAQLAGYVAEHSAYHHGQVSLCATIVGMAQNYVGSNNFNLLQPIGQFGTRHLNGKDAASARYIYTKLNNLTRYLFNEADDHIVQYLEEEDQIVEPKYYLPILPLILINGSEGIGTGFSTIVLPHKVEDVIEFTRNRINGKVSRISIGWQNFQGKIERDLNGSYLVKGVSQKIDENIVVSEIPVNRCIRDYKSFLEQLLGSVSNQDPHLQDMKEYHRGNQIQFVLKFIAQKQPSEGDMQKFLKLTSTYQQNNMHLFDKHHKIKKYDNIEGILEDFYEERIKGYEKRKQYFKSKFQKEFSVIQNQVRFIRALMEGEFSMMQSKEKWLGRLRIDGYARYQDLNRIESTKNRQQDDNDKNKDYSYLLNMPIWSFCQQKVDQLGRVKQQLQAIIDYYQKVSASQLWLKDIAQFQVAWREGCKGQDIKRHKDTSRVNRTVSKQQKQNKKRNRQTKHESSEQQDQVTVPRVRSRKTVKNMVQEEMERRHLRNSGAKKVKIQSSYQVETDKIQRQLMVQKQQKKQQAGIEKILSKYLCSQGKQNNLSLEERIRARISNGDPTFTASYNEAKQQMAKSELRIDKLQEEDLEKWIQ